MPLLAFDVLLGDPQKLKRHAQRSLLQPWVKTHRAAKGPIRGIDKILPSPAYDRNKVTNPQKQIGHAFVECIGTRRHSVIIPTTILVLKLSLNITVVANIL